MNTCVCARSPDQSLPRVSRTAEREIMASCKRGSTEQEIANPAHHCRSTKWVALKRAVGFFRGADALLADDAAHACCLASETVEGAALTLEGIHHVHGCHGLALGVLSVGDGVPDHVLEEHLEHTACLLVDQARDTLDTTTASEATDGWLGDALDVVTQHLTMTLRATLAEPLAALATSRHLGCCCCFEASQESECRVLAPRLSEEAAPKGEEVKRAPIGSRAARPLFAGESRVAALSPA